jgi:hypothetical protein
MELHFQDVRFALVYCGFVIMGMAAAWRMLRRKDVNGEGQKWPRVHVALSVLFLVSFVVWETIFSIYRYLIPLELLAPIVLYILVSRVIRRRHTRPAVCLALFVVIAGAMRAPDFGRLPWGEDWFGTKVPRMAESNGGLVVMTSAEPLAFVVPAFPRGMRFIHLEGIFSPTTETRLAAEARRIIAEHPGPLYLLSHRRGAAESRQTLVAYGLDAYWDRCVPVENRADPGVLLCEIRRIDDSRTSPDAKAAAPVGPEYTSNL